MSNRIDASSAYGNIARPTVWLDSRYSFKDLKVKAAFLQLWEGDFEALYAVEGRHLYIQARLPDDMQQDMPGILVSLSFHYVPVPADSFLCWRNVKAQSQYFFAGLYEKHFAAIMYRVLHRFVRSHGHLLPFSILDSVLNALFLHYHDKKQYAQMLDVQIIFVDVAMTLNAKACDSDKLVHNLQEMEKIMRGLEGFAEVEFLLRGEGAITAKACDSDKMVHNLLMVGKVLEALGRFGEAARVYREVAGSWSDHPDLAKTCYFAAVAFMRNNELEDAENQFVAALHWDWKKSPHRWELNSGETTNFIDEFAMMLYCKARALLQRDDEKVEAAFSGLLVAAGYQPTQSHYCRELFLLWQPQSLRMLKPKFRARKRAMGALVAAVQRPSVANFRQVLCSCLNPITSSLSRPFLCRVDKEGTKEDDLQAARRSILTKKVTMVLQCGNPTCRKPLEGLSNLCCVSLLFCERWSCCFIAKPDLTHAVSSSIYSSSTTAL